MSKTSPRLLTAYGIETKFYQWHVILCLRVFAHTPPLAWSAPCHLYSAWLTPSHPSKSLWRTPWPKDITPSLLHLHLTHTLVMQKTHLVTCLFKHLPLSLVFSFPSTLQSCYHCLSHGTHSTDIRWANESFQALVLEFPMLAFQNCTADGTNRPFNRSPSLEMIFVPTLSDLASS